jgi:hypothetical protein
MDVGFDIANINAVSIELELCIFFALLRRNLSFGQLFVFFKQLLELFNCSNVREYSSHEWLVHDFYKTLQIISGALIEYSIVTAILNLLISLDSL